MILITAKQLWKYAALFIMLINFIFSFFLSETVALLPYCFCWRTLNVTLMGENHLWRCIVPCLFGKYTLRGIPFSANVDRSLCVNISSSECGIVIKLRKHCECLLSHEVYTFLGFLPWDKMSEFRGTLCRADPLDSSNIRFYMCCEDGVDYDFPYFKRSNNF